MSRNKRKKRKKNGQKNKHQNNAASRTESKPTPPPASTPCEPDPVAPEVLWKLGELQANFDIAVRLGNCFLGDDKIEEAKEHEQIARGHLKESKKLKGVDPIKPGPVRKLSRAISDYERDAASVQSRRLYELREAADMLLQEVRRDAGLHRGRLGTLIFGNATQAIQKITNADPDLLLARENEFKELVTLCKQAEQTQRRQAADRLHGQLTRAELQDYPRALRLLKELEEYSDLYDLEQLRRSVENNRARAERYLAEEEAKHAAFQAQVERDIHVQALKRWYESLVGNRRARIKTGKILFNLRQAKKNDPVRLLEAIRVYRGAYATIDSEFTRYEELHQQAVMTAKGFKELEWIESAKTPEAAIDRMVEALERDGLQHIRHRDGVYRSVHNKLYPHRELIFKRVVKLIRAECPKCLELAFSLANWFFSDMDMGFHYIPDDESFESINLADLLYEASSKNHELEVCCPKQHAKKRAPWDSRSKQSKAASQ